MSDPHYPIGELSYTSPLTAEQKQQYLADIEHTPAGCVPPSADFQASNWILLSRDGGWTLRQVWLITSQTVT